MEKEGQFFPIKNFAYVVKRRYDKKMCKKEG